VSRLPPEEEMDDEDVAQLSLRGKGDWMHPPEDDEGSGYDPLPDDMNEKEIEAELERIKSRHQQRKETTNAENDE
jgi:inosine/xanthosine triphosphate pyrophosphatase family protein